ncbi:hypothetical protein PVAND_001087 [Polypedilum vanderplanki]|uniref:Uncharacterized protein n=1 Tax=Polypedilum vanderplanki TaxID=319348 RepID=A0A9J6BM94_POLVA|nr:hypothetical protein PVAND_001087 [Polypedilum vanderplanki]
MFKPTYDKATKVWSGPKVPPIFNPDQNLGQLIVKVLEQTPDAVTQISADTNVSVTCGEMRERILKFAVHLNNLGLKQGDVIGVVAGNTENIAPTVFACFFLGLPVNPLTPVMVKSNIVQMYSKTKPKLIFCDEKNLKIVQNSVDMMKSEAKIYTVMEKVENYECVTEILKENVNFDEFIFPKVDPNTTLIILCSSGTSGPLKGICKSHREVLSAMFPLYDRYLMNNPRFYVISAVFWASGFHFLLMTSLFNYTRIITAEPYEPKRFVDILVKYKINSLMTPPFMIINLVQNDAFQILEHMRLWFFAGAIVTKEIFKKLRPFIPNAMFVNGYGISEVNLLAINYEMKKPESSGYPVQNVDIMIADDEGNALENYQNGEIYAKVPIRFTEYFGEPEVTEKSFHGEWFKTGDVGHFDDEGFLYVVERKKDMIRFQGYHIIPSEIEAIINEIKGVMSSCVVGVEDKITGVDFIHAFVIVDEFCKITEQEIEDYVRKRVIDQKRIRGGVHFVKSFPLGITGKVDRKKVKEIAENFSKEAT